jgi:hypothetical protein
LYRASRRGHAIFRLLENIMMRVAPEDSAKLFAQAEKLGNVVQHTTESEDKTSAVVDSEAKLKSLTAYRDSLRSMLAKPALSVKDVAEIQENAKRCAVTTGQRGGYQKNSGQ